MTRRPLFLLLLPLTLALFLAGCMDRELPTGIAPPEPDFLVVTSPNTFTGVDAGRNHTCALRTDGVAECWGNNADGQAPASRSPTTGSFTQVSAGFNHTCALRSDGAAECWGDNADGRAPASRSPTTGSFTQVSAGFNYTCALRNDGAVECWGDNNWGQAPEVKVPVGGARFTQLSAGAAHACALRNDGAVECWGNNIWEHAPASRKPPVGLTFRQVGAGNAHTCALRSDGAVECWGNDNLEQAPASRKPPIGQSYTQVSGGGFYTCALRSDGVVECWGNDEYGQAPPSKSANPSTVRILPTASFSATPATVVAGQSFALALTDAQVPGWPGPVVFSYAFDCGDGSGYGAFGPSHTASCPTSAAGTRTVKGTVRDHHGDATEYTRVVEVTAFVLDINANGALTRGSGVVSGTVACAASGNVTLLVSLSQEQTKGKNQITIRGSQYVSVACSGTTNWTATVTPESGKFAAGAANASANVVNMTPPVQASRTVQLR